MGIVLFGPAIALEAVTGFPQWSSIFLIALVAVIYTSIGGIKAVIWTDVFQAAVMLAGMLAILIKGTMEAGGPAEVWRIAGEGGRLNFWNFDLDPRTRHTFWNLFVSSFLRGFGMVFSQATIQRISTTKNLSHAKMVLVSVAPGFFLTIFMALYEGIVAYAYYHVKGCDPLASREITNPNQLIPFTVMDIFQGWPGMPGLFLASLFSASLSTLSSGLSSLSAIVWADIFSPLLGDGVSEFKAILIAKASVVFFGASACGVAVMVSRLSGPLTQITGTLLSSFGAPLSAMFMIGCFFPRINAKGTIVGVFVGFVLTTWISMGMNFSKGLKGSPVLPSAPVTMCPVGSVFSNDTTWLPGNVSSFTTLGLLEIMTEITPTAEPEPELHGIEQIYELSYQWLGFVGTLATIISAYIVSLLTGANQPGDVDPRYLVPLSSIIFIFLPKAFQNKIASIGPQFIKEEYKAKFPDPAEKVNLREMEIEVKSMLDEDSLGEDFEKQKFPMT